MENPFERIAMCIKRMINECALESTSSFELTHKIKDILSSLMTHIDVSLQNKNSYQYYYEEVSLQFVNSISDTDFIQDCLTIQHINQHFNRVICLLFYRIQAQTSGPLAISINEGANDLFKIELKEKNIVCKAVFDVLLVTKGTT